jgi:hypothetical protein
MSVIIHNILKHYIFIHAETDLMLHNMRSEVLTVMMKDNDQLHGISFSQFNQRNKRHETDVNEKQQQSTT